MKKYIYIYMAKKQTKFVKEKKKQTKTNKLN